MSKIRRIIQLLNLLHAREFVSLETMMKVCEIPRRTTFRYINTLSSADIPIYFDNRERAYTLRTKRNGSLEDISIGEVTVAILALKMLRKNVNEHYSSDIDILIRKLLVRQVVPLEDMFTVIDNIVRQADSIDDVSDIVSSLLALVAANFGRNVRLTRSSEDDNSSDGEFENISLVFQDGWNLDSDFLKAHSALDLKSIQKISVL